MSSPLKYRPVEERELAKDFGFDVTAPSGGVQTSAVCNREHKTECRKIYSEFLMNMRDYIYQEEQIKHDLIKMREQVSSPQKDLRDSYSSLSARSPAIRRSSEANSEGFCSRQGSIKLNKQRPKTVIGNQRKVSSERVLSNVASPRNSTKRDHNAVTQNDRDKDVPHSIEDHNAIVESSADFACSRVIKMNPRAYSKLVCGKANVNVVNRSAGYLLKPVADSKTKTLMPKDVGRHARSNCPERLAIMREKTDFKSHTLSNDLKVNNLLAIKKSLVGDVSPRVTVGDVMNSARERRSRVYRIQLKQDEIDNPAPLNQSSPRDQHFPYSTPCSPRLTRQNLAKFEKDLQKEATEILRQTVVDMVARVQNKGHGNQNSNQLDQLHTGDHEQGNKFSGNQNHLINDVVDHKPDQRSKLHNRRVSYHKDVKRYVSQGPRFQASCTDSPRARLRSEMSMRPSTIQSGFCSENSSPRHVTHHDTMTFIRQSREVDMDRDLEMNRWRQRMIFVVGK